MTQTRDELLKLAKDADCMHVNLYGDQAKSLERLERFAALLSAHQAQAEPVGTVRHYNVGGSGERHSIAWKGLPPPDETVLYTAPPSSDQTWNDAIEAAAQECEQWNATPGGRLAARLRTLARPSQAKDAIPFVATVLFDNETRVVEGHIDSSAFGTSQAQEREAFLSHLDKSSQTVKGWPSWKQQAHMKLVSGAVDEREAFEATNKHLDYTHSKDAWGRDIYKHSHIQVAWEAWQARATLSRAQQAPAVSAMREAMQAFCDRVDRGEIRIKVTYAKFKALLDASIPFHPAAAPVSEQTKE